MLFSVTILGFISLNNVIYADAYVCLNVNDKDVVVGGTFVNELFDKFGEYHTFIKTATLTASLMRLSICSQNYIRYNKTQPVIQRGVFDSPENVLAGRKSFKVACPLGCGARSIRR